MLQKKTFSPVFLAWALTFVTAISCLQSAGAQEEDGISVGKLRFGSQSNDKWLTVDLKKTNRIGNPTVNTSSSQYSGTTYHTRSNSPTNYLGAYSTQTPLSLPAVYPPASSMVSNRKLVQAADIALNSAHVHSTGSCWRYVKSALLKAEAINSYPKTGYAKQAGLELVHDYGFVRTTISNPFSAPVGSVLVYGGSGAGHVEIRTRTGFVSDFVSAKPSGRPLIGVFVKR